MMGVIGIPVAAQSPLPVGAIVPLRPFPVRPMLGGRLTPKSAWA